MHAPCDAQGDTAGLVDAVVADSGVVVAFADAGLGAVVVVFLDELVDESLQVTAVLPCVAFTFRATFWISKSVGGACSSGSRHRRSGRGAACGRMLVAKLR